MLKRRIKRDSKLRGYDRFDVEYKFENHVIPAIKNTYFNKEIKLILL